MSLLQAKIREIEKRLLSSEKEIIGFQTKNLIEIKRNLKELDISDEIIDVVYFPLSYEIYKRNTKLVEVFRVYDEGKIDEALDATLSVIDEQSSCLISLYITSNGSNTFPERFLPLLKVKKSILSALSSMLKKKECNDMSLFLEELVINISFLDDEWGKPHYNFSCNRPQLLKFS